MKIANINFAGLKCVKKIHILIPNLVIVFLLIFSGDLTAQTSFKGKTESIQILGGHLENLKSNSNYNPNDPYIKEKFGFYSRVMENLSTSINHPEFTMQNVLIGACQFDSQVSYKYYGTYESFTRGIYSPMVEELINLIKL